MTAKYDFPTFMDWLGDTCPQQAEFHQAVAEVAADIIPVINDTPEYQGCALLERLTEPDRTIAFRVAWERDDGSVQVNRGYRVQFNSAIGPYKGGLRFHETVNLSILKFLGFEQTLKNALTGLPMGGGKGGSDFDPSGCSADEIRRFCNTFMLELHHHIGAHTDIPAGDINVGPREIGWLFGAWRRITGRFEAALTGKGEAYGGSAMRVEATGYGLLHFLCHMLEAHAKSVDGQTIVISGAGNVATHAAEKAVQMGARVITLSDSTGLMIDNDGLTQEKIDWVRRYKADRRGSLKACAKKFKAEWHEGKTPWGVECDVALPCATQNELHEDDAKALRDSGCIAVAEGANMPCTHDAIKVFNEAGILFGPGKAANAGGVSVSGLEISQNQRRRPSSREVVEQELHELMRDIHDRCKAEGGTGNNHINYAKGANIAGFKKVADAMVAQGTG
jgi:glutamate dehydrogenase (NADP+)